MLQGVTLIHRYGLCPLLAHLLNHNDFSFCLVHYLLYSIVITICMCWLNSHFCFLCWSLHQLKSFENEKCVVPFAKILLVLCVCVGLTATGVSSITVSKNIIFCSYFSIILTALANCLNDKWSGSPVQSCLWSWGIFIVVLSLSLGHIGFKDLLLKSKVAPLAVLCDRDGVSKVKSFQTCGLVVLYYVKPENCFSCFAIFRTPNWLSCLKPKNCLFIIPLPWSHMRWFHYVKVVLELPDSSYLLD